MRPSYVRADLVDLETNPEKPGRRWEVSPQLGIGDYNFNVAIVEPGERLSQSGYHYHESQTEFFYVVSGRCRVETEDGSFDMGADGMVLFPRAAVHLLHNPFDGPCKLIAIGSPPAGRRPSHRVQSYQDLLAERYPDEHSSDDPDRT